VQKLRYKEVHGLYSSPVVIILVISVETRWMVESKANWRWCITLRIAEFLGFVHRPEFQILENTTFRKLDLCLSSGEERERHLILYICLSYFTCTWFSIHINWINYMIMMYRWTNEKNWRIRRKVNLLCIENERLCNREALRYQANGEKPGKTEKKQRNRKTLQLTAA
jgi:hypothetical protein